MPANYIDEAHCSLCDRDTRQLFHDAGHERDSSNDWRRCLECGGSLGGSFSQWLTGTPPTDEEVKYWLERG
jgi:hypothetical protein